MIDTTANIDGDNLDAVSEALIMQPQAPAKETAQDEDVSETDAPLEEEQVDDNAAATEDEDETEEVEASDKDAEDYTDEEDDEGDEQPAPEFHTVKVDGAEKQVTLDELKRGYSGQQYIQEQMRQTAEAKKEAEAIYSQLQQEAQQVAALRQQLESGQARPMPAPPDDSQFQSDPIGYMEAKMAYDRDMAAYQEQMGQIQQVSQRQEAMRQQALQYQLKEESQKLIQAIPEFADPEKGAKLKEQIVSTGVEYGYTPEELGQVADARAVKILHDAMRYRQMLAARDSAKEKVQKARPVLKPGAKKTANQGKMAKRQKVAARMKQTGSVDDVANFLLS